MAQPFLKWPGGKRWLVPYISKIVCGLAPYRYFEPFLGGGATFFGLGPRVAHLSDINGDLINVYEQVKEHPDDLIAAVKRLPVDAVTYARLRSTEPLDKIERAVRFLYLNRTAFGGMYRLNRQGQFNVPYGNGNRSPQALWRDELIVKASAALQDASIAVADFTSAICNAGEGDLIYCDPTYTVTHNDNGFRRYNECNFTWADQVRLADIAGARAKKGAVVLVSNAFHPDVAGLYPGAHAQVVKRKSRLCPKGKHRRDVYEYLFVLGPDKSTVLDAILPAFTHRQLIDDPSLFDLT